MTRKSIHHFQKPSLTTYIRIHACIHTVISHLKAKAYPYRARLGNGLSATQRARRDAHLIPCTAIVNSTHQPTAHPKRQPTAQQTCLLRVNPDCFATAGACRRFAFWQLTSRALAERPIETLRYVVGEDRNNLRAILAAEAAALANDTRDGGVGHW